MPALQDPFAASELRILDSRGTLDLVLRWVNSQSALRARAACRPFRDSLDRRFRVCSRVGEPVSAATLAAFQGWDSSGVKAATMQSYLNHCRAILLLLPSQQQRDPPPMPLGGYGGRIRMGMTLPEAIASLRQSREADPGGFAAAGLRKFALFCNATWWQHRPAARAQADGGAQLAVHGGGSAAAVQRRPPSARPRTRPRQYWKAQQLQMRPKTLWHPGTAPQSAKQAQSTSIQ
jgi:hypothetical protein